MAPKQAARRQSRLRAVVLSRRNKGCPRGADRTGNISSLDESNELKVRGMSPFLSPLGVVVCEDDHLFVAVFLADLNWYSPTQWVVSLWFSSDSRQSQVPNPSGPRSQVSSGIF